MKLTAVITNLFRPVVARQLAPNRRSGWLHRRTARASLFWFLFTFLALNVTAYFVIEANGSYLRDPEYGRRIFSLRERIAENPGRPLVLVVGSSRSSMGVRPAAWESARPQTPHDPLLFNMSLVGSGPLMELMCLRRVYSDGIQPDAVILEYWPPFLREDGPYYEPSRIDHARLSDRDRPLVHEYFDKPEDVEGKMRRDRINPLFESRQRLLAQACPRWQPWDRRMDMCWGNLDGWGWLSGLEENYPPDPHMRNIRLQHCEKTYRPQFKDFTIHPMADRAFRESVALARSHGAQVAIVYMPEASEFRSWMPPAVEKMAQEHLARLRSDLRLPIIDARLWMEDGYLVDGFHLSRIGATLFTERFGPEIIATFPDLGRR